MIIMTVLMNNHNYYDNYKQDNLVRPCAFALRRSLASGRSVSVDAGGSLRQARDVQVV